MNKLEKVYAVWRGEYSDKSIAAIFKNKEKADKYIELNSEIDEYDDYYIHEYELYDDKITSHDEVKTYYVCTIRLEDCDRGKAGEFELLEDECIDTLTEEQIKHQYTEKRMYTKDSFHEEFNGYLTSYSRISFNHAKKVALDYYYEKKAYELDL